MKHLFRKISLLSLMAGMLIGCGPKEIGGFPNYLTAPGKNPEKSYRIASSWTKTGIGTHFHSGPDAGPVIMYSLEGCMQYVRTSTKFYYLVAESFTHNDDHTSVIKIRDNAKWHNGDDVVAMDIKSYYALCVTDFSKNVLDMEVIDSNSDGDLTNDKELKVYWKPWREPTNYAKDMLLAMDTKNCSVK